MIGATTHIPLYFYFTYAEKKKKEEESTKKKRRKNDQRSRESRITDIGEREDHSIEDIIYIYIAVYLMIYLLPLRMAECL
jgi:hypothetical protein